VVKKRFMWLEPTQTILHETGSNCAADNSFCFTKSLSIKSLQCAARRRRIFFSPKAKTESQYNIIKHMGGLPEGHTPIVLNTLGNAEYDTSNIMKKEKRKRT